MPNYVGYSPWQDAAEVGKGIGDALGAVLFKLPMLRAEERRKDRETELQERHYKAIEGLYGSRENLMGAQAQQAPLLLALKTAKANLDNQRFDEQMRMNDAKMADMEGRRADTSAYQSGRLGLGEREATTRANNAETLRGQLRLEQISNARNHEGGDTYPRELYPNIGGQQYESLPDAAPMTNAPAKPGILKRLGDAASGFFSRQNAVSSEWSGTSNIPVSQPQGGLAPPPTNFNSLSSPDLQSLQLQGNDGMQSLVPLAKQILNSNDVQMNSRDVPPTPEHRYHVQDPTTGNYYWSNERGLSNNPHLKVLQKF